MSGSVRSLVPGIALAAAGVVALSPAMVAPSVTAHSQPVVQIPAVHVEEIALAGIGRDIYNSITNFVQYTVSSAQYWIGLVPVIGPPLADQLGINYFTLIQPVIASTVYVISDLIANPFAFVQLAANYGSNLFYAGYNWASEQAQFFGFPPFAPIPPPPPLAATRGGAAAVEAPAAGGQATSRVRAAAAVEAPAVEAPEAPAVEAPAVDGPAVEAPAAAGDRRGGVRAVRQSPRVTPAATESAEPAVAGAADQASPKARAEARSSRASAGAGQGDAAD